MPCWHPLPTSHQSSKRAYILLPLSPIKIKSLPKSNLKIPASAAYLSSLRHGPIYPWPASITRARTRRSPTDNTWTGGLIPPLKLGRPQRCPPADYRCDARSPPASDNRPRRQHTCPNTGWAENLDNWRRGRLNTLPSMQNWIGTPMLQSWNATWSIIEK